MDRFNALGRGAQIMLVAGILLLIDSFLRWQEISIDVLGVEASGGVSAWDDIGGILMGLLTIALVAWIGARLAGVQIPLPVSPAMVGAVLAVLILVLAVVKNLEDDFSTFWAWVGIVLAIAIAVGAWLEVQAAGGLDALKGEMPAMGTSGTASSAPSAPAGPTEPMSPPPPAAEAAPPPPSAEPEAAPEQPGTSYEEPSRERDV